MKIDLKQRTDKGKKVKRLRLQQLIPASVYGPKRKPISVTVDYQNFTKVYSEAGSNKLIDLNIEGEKEVKKGIIQEVQKNPVKATVAHVSFYEVDMTKPIQAEIPVEFVGEPPAVKLNVGILVTPMMEIPVKCLPKDLPSSITVNISQLANIGDTIALKDITLPQGVEFAANLSMVHAVASIAAPQKQLLEEVAVAEPTAEGAEVAPADAVTVEKKEEKVEKKVEKKEKK